MPRKGYRSITIPEDLFQRLQDMANLYGTTVQSIIKIALADEKFSMTAWGACDLGFKSSRSHYNL